MLARTRLSSGITAVLLALGVASAETLTVSNDPLAADFSSIQAAVDAATSGDTILVEAGDFDGFRLASKSLTILGAGNGQTRIVALPGLSSIQVVSGSSGPIRIGGFLIESDELDSGLVFLPQWVYAEDCTSPLELFDIEVRNPISTAWDFISGKGNVNLNSGYVTVSSCRQVMLSNVRVTGAAEQDLGESEQFGFPFTTREGTAGLAAFYSRVWASNCRFEGCPISQCFSGTLPVAPLRSGSGARLWNSRLVASNTQFVGGPGRVSPDSNCLDLQAGPGISTFFGSQVVLHDGPSASIQGGAGSGSAPAAAGIDLYGPSSLITDSGIQALGGMEGDGSFAPGIAEVSPDLVQIITLEGVRPALVPSAYVATGGTTIDLELQGNPDALHLVAWDALLNSPTNTPLIDGDLFLDPSTATTLGVFTLDANGQGSASLSMPQGASFLGLSVAMQSIELAQPQFFLSPPIYLAVNP